MILPAHVRMARAALRWTRTELALAAGLAKNTVGAVEEGRSCSTATLSKLEAALTRQGCSFFTENGGAGVIYMKEPACTGGGSG